MSLDMIAAAIILITLVLVRIRVVADNQRFAVFSAGGFSELKGPGLVFVLPGFGTRWIKIRVGDPGTLAGTGSAIINGANIPIAFESEDMKGQRIRVTGFSADKVLVTGET